jgi:hypothetical protein
VTRYFAPPYVLAIPVVLWLFRRRDVLGLVSIWIVVWVVVSPTWKARHNAALEAAQYTAQFEPAKQWLAANLKPGEVALATSYTPFADERYFGLVQAFVDYSPPYPYRIIDDSRTGVISAQERGLKVRYYVGSPVASVNGTGIIQASFGPVSARVVAPLVAEIHGRGVDTLLTHPDAPYDPWTGYYKDSDGRYWDNGGTEIFSPPRRRYLASQHLWVDSYGDLWNAAGDRVGNRPDLRTVP